MTVKPHMILPNGDIIREGDYAITRDGRKVGPMVPYTNDGTNYYWTFESSPDLWRSDGTETDFKEKDLIAKWHDVEPGPDPVTPDYNKGEWHTWNGGECPVHPKSVVEAYYRQKDGRPSPESPVTDVAGLFDWKRENAYTLVFFRVVTPYVEPAPDPVTPPAARDLRDFDLTNPYGTPYGLLDEVYGSGTADAMIAHGGPWQQYTQGAWREVDSSWIDQRAYRVKPEREVVTVTMPGTVASGFSSGHVCETDTHKITFNTIDGKPDCASIRMEPLE